MVRHCCILRRAGNGTRTRDPNLGKVVLYQLSYSRSVSAGNQPSNWPHLLQPLPELVSVVAADRSPRHGGEGDRTPDLVNAIHALSQLSYAPAIIVSPARVLEFHAAS